MLPETLIVTFMVCDPLVWRELMESIRSRGMIVSELFAMTRFDPVGILLDSILAAVSRPLMFRPLLAVITRWRFNPE